MSGIQVLILRKDFTLIKKKIRPNVSHIHYGNGSYLNRGDAILKAPDENDPPRLIFQEGNALPMNATPKKIVEIPKTEENDNHSLNSIKWETWYIPMLRGLNRKSHDRFEFNLRRLFTLNTLPFWIIGLALLWHFLSPILFPSPPISPTPTPLP